MKKLQTLEEFNLKQSAKYRTFGKMEPCWNGIECPNCKNELVDTNPREKLLSSPPKKAIKCLNCDYAGYRYC